MLTLYIFQGIADFEHVPNLENPALGDLGENKYWDITAAIASNSKEEFFKLDDLEKINNRKSVIPSITKLTILEKNDTTAGKLNILEEVITSNNTPDAGEYLKYSEELIEALVNCIIYFI